MYQFNDASSSDIPTIQEIAEKTWWPTYSPILKDEQIRYMLDTIYGPETLRSVMISGDQKFFLLLDEERTMAFASYGLKKNEPGVYKLHKLYVLPGSHGKGYGRALVEETSRRVKKAGGRFVDLNVNRDNPAKAFYEKLGFRIIRVEDVPIGPYWMNDYVMRLEV